MTWNHFPLMAGLTLLLALTGSFLPHRQKREARACMWASGVTMSIFIAGLWLTLQRPPLRTLGETRLWYGYFLFTAGFAAGHVCRLRWLPLLTTLMAAVFWILNILQPQQHDQTLVPALQSPWFVPHVAIYMLAYALLACAALTSLSGHGLTSGSVERLMRPATALLTLGMLTGAVWAHLAWGDFWTWDPKETWAAATWCAALIYLHRRPLGLSIGCGRWLVWLTFLLMQMCWYGYRWLPWLPKGLHDY